MIGGGDGGVLREIVKHTTVEEISICEIDEVISVYAKRRVIEEFILVDCPPN